MPKPKTLSCADLVRIFAIYGFEVASQRGSHIKLEECFPAARGKRSLCPIIANWTEEPCSVFTGKRFDISRRRNSPHIFSTDECARLFACSRAMSASAEAWNFGLCATRSREPRQARKGATVSGTPRVPQFTRSSSHLRVFSRRSAFRSRLQTLRTRFCCFPSGSLLRTEY